MPDTPAPPPPPDMNPEQLHALNWRAQYLTNINNGLAGSLRMLKAQILLANTDQEIFPQAKIQLKSELLQIVQILDSNEAK